MALVYGTNCGFVTTAPTDDPSEASKTAIDTSALAFRCISPTGNYKLTEIGWYNSENTEEADMCIGIYEDSAGSPGSLLTSGTLAKGTTGGWKKLTGLNVTLTSGTYYWLAVQVDNTATQTSVDIKTGSYNLFRKTSQTTLPNPWGSTDVQHTYITAIYGLCELIVTPTPTPTYTYPNTGLVGSGDLRGVGYINKRDNRVRLMKTKDSKYYSSL